MKKRILSFVLALLIVLTVLPPQTFAVDMENTSEGKEQYAKITTESFFYVGMTPGAMEQFAGKSDFPALMVVMGVDSRNGTTYYQLKAAENNKWPVTLEGGVQKLTDGVWVKADYVVILEFCEICQKYDCGLDHTTDPTTPNDPEIPDVLDKITVEGIPEGAVVEADDLSDVADGNSNIGIYDIKVKDENGNFWQPTPGETVKVTIPAPAGAEKVTIVHFLEDPAIIKYMLDNNLLEAIDASMAANDEKFQIFEPAVKAYQEAAETDEICILFEVFEDVSVVNGTVTVDVNGFSVFTSVPPGTITVGQAQFPIGGTNTYSVRLDEWVRVEGWVLYGDIEITSGAEYCDVVDAGSIGLFGDTAKYIHIHNDADIVGEYVELDIGTLWSRKIRLNIVADFDYGNVYIGIVGPNTAYPNELATHANAQVESYFYNGTLNSARSTYCMNPDVIINLDAIKNSNLTVMHDTKTVYGVADTTGGNTGAFLRTTVSDENRAKGMKSFAEIADDILSAYFADDPEQIENHRVVPYVVKHETIGDDAGWYINCKIELKDTYLLQYDYNFPQGFDEFDITAGAKPSDRTVSTANNENGTVTTTVDSSTMMTIKTTLRHPENNQSQEVTAVQVGWATRPDVSATDEENILSAGESVSMTGNTTLYAVWQITSDDWSYTKFTWTIDNYLLDQQYNPVSSNATFTFNIAVNGTDEFPATYTLYDKTGLQVGDTNRTFGANNQFTLQDGQYIVIQNVPVSGSYTVTQTQTVDGYTCWTPSNTPDTASASQTGNLTTYFVNIQNIYSITYDLTDDNNITGTNHADNPTSYTVGSGAITLKDPTPPTGYKFVRWAEGNTIAAGSTGEKTFTAVWELALADLEITISGHRDADQSYVFAVYRGTGNNKTFVMNVVIPANKTSVTIKDLPVDTYTVTPVSGWVWRLKTDDNGQVELNGNKTVEFQWTLIDKLIYWLNGYSYNKKGG